MRPPQLPNPLLRPPDSPRKSRRRSGRTCHRRGRRTRSLPRRSRRTVWCRNLLINLYLPLTRQHGSVLDFCFIIIFFLHLHSHTSLLLPRDWLIYTQTALASCTLIGLSLCPIWVPLVPNQFYTCRREIVSQSLLRKAGLTGIRVR